MCYLRMARKMYYLCLMVTFLPKNPRPPAAHIHATKRGFALVVAITMLILLTALAVGLLSLSSISLRASAESMLMQEARQNARLALMLAIGELQTSTGPDQRITAAAGIRGSGTAQSHLTGVWNGWKWDGEGSAPDMDARKESDFVRWLVSSPRPQDAENIGYANTTPAGNKATLVRGNVDVSDLVEAPLVPVATSGNAANGGFAWAVFDESTKLPISLPGSESDATIDTLNAMASAPVPGYGVSTSSTWSGLADAGLAREKLVTPGGSALAGVAPQNRGFHDITDRSAGLVTNVAGGGLAMDLSRLFDENQLPGDFATRFLYSDSTTPMVDSPRRFSGANPMPPADPSWRMLHSHYRLHRQISGSGGSASLASTLTPRPPAGSASRVTRSSPHFLEQQVAPVISKAQFVFSLSFQNNPQSLGLSARPDNSSLPAGQQDLYITWFVTDPVITLWNPYNHTIRVPAARVDLYRVPMAFRVYKNGTLINRQYTHFANTFWSYHFDGRGRYYRLNLVPPAGQSEIVMAPGEHLVFTAYTSSGHAGGGGGGIETNGINLRPGFTPPAGNNSEPTVGGITTLNVTVAPDGSDGGTDYGRNVRTVAVKPGDLIEIDVQPQVLDIARSSETGGRDIAGYLKYYVGNPNDPTLMGAIEIDYDKDIDRFLPSLTRRELPAIRVRRDIPQGGNPPQPHPNLTFKEPFLITTFQLKTERDSRFPSRGWLHNSPTNLYASAGIDQKQPWNLHQYELSWEPMMDWPPASPTIEISNDGNRGYGGSGVYAQSGVEFATFSSIPQAPALSLAQLRHAPLNQGGQLPLSSQVVAGSFASPMLPADRVRATEGDFTLLDHSYLANNALFDRTFFSGLATPGGPHASGQPGVLQAITGNLENGQPLANPRFSIHSGGRTASEIASLVTASDGHLKSAAHLLINSPFNVNSTRVDVWEAIIASTYGVDVPVASASGVIHRV